MEEKIKVLEELQKYCSLRSIGLVMNIDDNDEWTKFVTAILDIIDSYRTLEKHIGFYEKNGSYKARILELEEKLDNSRKANELLNKTNNELRLEIRTTYSKVVNDIISKFNLGDDYISKSKVQEKIEELNKNELLCKMNFENIKFTIEVLQELMED